MDSYVEKFQAAGGSLVMLAKGNRSGQVTRACEQYGGFYLGSIGGPAARLLSQFDLDDIETTVRTIRAITQRAAEDAS